MLPVVYVTRVLLDQTVSLLASFAADREPRSEGAAPGDDAEDDETEGVVYWLGIESGKMAVVTTLVVPDATAGSGHVRTSAAANAEVVQVMIDTPLVLLGQVHSHPGNRVNHSWVDDRDTFAQFEGSLSVVVPFYGKRGWSLERVGVHRVINGEFSRIAPRRVHEHLRVIPGFADLRKRVAR